MSPAVARAVDWLLAKEVRNPGDWQTRRPGVEPSGWHFQYRNEFYPDIDDTAMVLLALLRSPEADDTRGPGGRLPRRRTGCSRCRIATAAGLPSTSTSTTRF